MTDDKSLDVRDYLQGRAKDVVIARHDDVVNPGPGLDAEIAHEMFVQSVEVRQVFREFQGALSAYVLREHLWVHFPHNEFADTYKGFRAFLASTGLGDSTVSELAALYHVVTLCDNEDIDIDRFLGSGQWTRTRETITVLKQASKDKEVKKVKQILSSIDEVRHADTTVARAALRKQYRKQWDKAKPGHGTTFNLEDGREAVVVVFDDDIELKKALVKLGSLTEWDLRDVELKVLA